MHDEIFDDRVFRFRITLLDTDPAIWRLIDVPGWYDFRELHVAIQGAMGWTDSHLHMFTPVGESWSSEWQIGIPLDDLDEETIAGWEIPIIEHFGSVGDALDYTYDFGDGWEHRVELTGVSLASSEIQTTSAGSSAPAATYPRCLDGAGSCPPEDCGGPHGFSLLREILPDPTHEQYDEMLEWVGGPDHATALLDPEPFDPSAVTFDDPDDRWDHVFGGRTG